jgi:hypothetical protein
LRRVIEGAGLVGAVLLLLGLGRAVGVMLGFAGVGLVWWLAFLAGFYLLSVAIAYTSARLPALIEDALEPVSEQTFDAPAVDEQVQRWQQVVASMSPAAGRLDASLPADPDSPTVEQVVPRVVACEECGDRGEFPLVTGWVWLPVGGWWCPGCSDTRRA